MDEKIIIRSESYSENVVLSIVFCVTYVASILITFPLVPPASYLEIVNISGIYRMSLLSILISVCVALFVKLCYLKTEMIVSDKRIYGKTVFGKRVDLPKDSVSSVGTSWPKGISVATSSGKVSFLLIKNRDEIHKVISNLLVERQNNINVSTPTVCEVLKSDADELKKYKELLDSGIITQEEFDAKKKQILGL